MGIGWDQKRIGIDVTARWWKAQLQSIRLIHGCGSSKGLRARQPSAHRVSASITTKECVLSHRTGSAVRRRRSTRRQQPLVPSHRQRACRTGEDAAIHTWSRVEGNQVTISGKIVMITMPTSSRKKKGSVAPATLKMFWPVNPWMTNRLKPSGGVI